ncbi:MAG: DegV family protein [Bacilli bacterium]
MKTAIVTDSTSYIPKELRESLNIHMIPLSVIIDGESFEEEVDLQTEELFSRMSSAKDFPKTSQPSVGRFLELFEKLQADYDAVVSIHLSSGISGTYQGAVSAGNMVEGLEVFPFDSEISCLMQGYYAIEAAKMAQAGETPQAIIVRLNEMKESMDARFMVDDLAHLQRGGRLSATAAMIGGLLQVKPILHFVDTKIVPAEKVRTRKKAIKRLIELAEDQLSSGNPMQLVVISNDSKSEAEAVAADLRAKYPHASVDLSYFGPVIATHLGPDAFAIGWYKI